MPNLRQWLTSERLLVGGLLVLTVVVRAGALVAMRENLRDDPDLYRHIAENLLQHGEYALAAPAKEGSNAKISPTAYRPPMYPLLLSNLPTTDGQQVSLLKVGVIHVLLGVATVWLTYAAARRMFPSHANDAPRSKPDRDPLNPRSLIACLLAGLLVACDPILLHQQTLAMTETLAAFLAILSLWCLVRFDAAPLWFNAGLAGGAIGLSVLCRPTFLPWLGLVGVAMVITRGGNARARTHNSDGKTSNFAGWFDGLGLRFVHGISLVIVAAAVVSPWAIRNYHEFGKPIATTTHGGYTLWLGNNLSFYNWLKNSHSDLPWDVEKDRTEAHRAEEAVWRANIVLGMSLSDSPLPYELAADQLHSDLAWKAIREDVSGFVRASVYRIGQLWSPLPHKLTADESTGRMLLRYAAAMWYVGVYLLGALGAWRLRWSLVARPWLWGILLCITFTAVHTFYWSNLRMRAPLIPIIALVAAAAIAPMGRGKSAC